MSNRLNKKLLNELTKDMLVNKKPDSKALEYVSEEMGFTKKAWNTRISYWIHTALNEGFRCGYEQGLKETHEEIKQLKDKHTNELAEKQRIHENSLKDVTEQLNDYEKNERFLTAELKAAEATIQDLESKKGNRWTAWVVGGAVGALVSAVVISSA